MDSILQYHGLYLQKKIKDKEASFNIGSPFKLNEDGSVSLCEENDFFATSLDKFPNINLWIGKIKEEYCEKNRENITLNIGRSVWFIHEDLILNKIKLNTGDFISVKNGKYNRAFDKNYYIGKVISPAEYLDDGIGNKTGKYYQILFFETPVDRLGE